MKKLKERWGIETNWQLFVILLVFSVTGSSAAKLAGPWTAWLGVTKEVGLGLYWTVRILSVFPIYQVLLVLFGWLFGEFDFFWAFEKKMLKRMGLKFLFKE